MLLRRFSRLATSCLFANNAARMQHAFCSATSSFAARLQDGPGLADFVQAGADPLSAEHSGLDQVCCDVLLIAVNACDCASR